MSCIGHPVLNPWNAELPEDPQAVSHPHLQLDSSGLVSDLPYCRENS